MTDAGEAAIERAVADGTWSFLDDVEKLIVPDDLRNSLNAANSLRGFESMTKSAKRAVLEWVKSAKRPQTRATRIAATVEAATRGESPLR